MIKHYILNKLFLILERYFHKNVYHITVGKENERFISLDVKTIDWKDGEWHNVTVTFRAKTNEKKSYIDGLIVNE